MKTATTLGEVKFSCDPRPLTPDELGEFFVETAQARDPQSNRRFEIAEALGSPDEHVKILLAGHSGAGKSTELTKFCQERRELYHPVVFSIRREATLSNVTIEQLLILIVEKVLSSATHFHDELSTETLDAVYEWFKETFEKSETTRSGSIEVGGEIKAKGPSLFGLLRIGAWLKADMRAGAQVIHTATMHDILGRRMRLELIAADALEMAIDKTGGVPRDLFEVLISAASVAQQALRADAKILREDVRYGLNRRKSRILQSVSVAGLPDIYHTVTVEQLFERLHEYGEKTITNPPSDAVNLALMQAHALIEYNGERWFRVHPLVSEHVQAIFS
jgi:hypothetical protein